MNQTRTEPPTVAVVGGGLAGLAASCVLSNTGFRVSLFERRSYLGGRASSYQHPGTGEVVDNCQHLFRGRRTNSPIVRVQVSLRAKQQLTALAYHPPCPVMSGVRCPSPHTDTN